MTATSGPGFSLKQEAISFAAGMEIPLLVVDINRSGPGLGNLGPEQSDYNQAVKGGGHGDYHPIVLAPNSVQEMASFPSLGFDLSFQYRNPVFILADAFLGQCKEDIVFQEAEPTEYDVSWAARGSENGKRHILTSIHFDHDEQEQIERGLQQKFHRIRERETRCETYLTDDAEVVIVAYGITSRICKSYVNEARKQGFRVGLLRPITLFPFPYSTIRSLAEREIDFLTVELSGGQMVEDVRLGVNGRSNVYFYNRLGGNIPSESELHQQMKRIMNDGG